MSKSSEQAPTAPIEEEHHVNAPAPTVPTPYQTSTPYATTGNSPYPLATGGPSSPTYGATDSIDYNQPPPSYADALNYPQLNHPPASMPKPYTPQTEMPINGVYPQPNSSINAGAPLGAPLPQTYGHPQPNVVRTVITTTVAPNGNCVWCRAGNVQNETDLCCLICLILLAICTFPFGLVLLCCIPCTVRPRCNRCRRLQD